MATYDGHGKRMDSSFPEYTALVTSVITYANAWALGIAIDQGWWWLGFPSAIMMTVSLLMFIGAWACIVCRMSS